jgi:hypothetical protein
MSAPAYGSPADRGSADAYYGRPPKPHKYLDGLVYQSERIILTDPVEIQEYMSAYANEDDRKDWGK